MVTEVQIGTFRRRVDIQIPKRGTDSAGGPLVDQWKTVATNVACSIESLSGREYFTARQVQSAATIQIMMRFRRDVTTSVRLVHWKRGQDCAVSPPLCDIYDIEAVLPDRSGLRYLTLMCSLRDAKGFRSGN